LSSTLILSDEKQEDGTLGVLEFPIWLKKKKNNFIFE